MSVEERLISLEAENAELRKRAYGTKSGGSTICDSQWLVTIAEDTVSLRRLNDGGVEEVYAPVSKERGAIYLAAISQGFQPPRDLRLFDKPVD